jgi:hypothetical protein
VGGNLKTRSANGVKLSLSLGSRPSGLLGVGVGSEALMFRDQVVSARREGVG